MGLVEAWGGNALGWFFAHLIEAPFNLFYALTHPSEWLAWLGHVQISGKIADLEAAQSLIRFIYYGASWELFFVFLFLFFEFPFVIDRKHGFFQIDAGIFDII